MTLNLYLLRHLLSRIFTYLSNDFPDSSNWAAHVTSNWTFPPKWIFHYILQTDTSSRSCSVSHDVYRLLATEAVTVRLSLCLTFFLLSVVFGDPSGSVLSGSRLPEPLSFLLTISVSICSTSHLNYSLYVLTLIQKALHPRWYSLCLCFDCSMVSLSLPQLLPGCPRSSMTCPASLSPSPLTISLTHTRNQPPRIPHAFLWGLRAFPPWGLGVNHSSLQRSPCPPNLSAIFRCNSNITSSKKPSFNCEPNMIFSPGNSYRPLLVLLLWIVTYHLICFYVLSSVRSLSSWV